jgi:hypothetical protein
VIGGKPRRCDDAVSHPAETAILRGPQLAVRYAIRPRSDQHLDLTVVGVAPLARGGQRMPNCVFVMRRPSWNIAFILAPGMP